MLPEKKHSFLFFCLHCLSLRMWQLSHRCCANSFSYLASYGCLRLLRVSNATDFPSLYALRAYNARRRIHKKIQSVLKNRVVGYKLDSHKILHNCRF